MILDLLFSCITFAQLKLGLPGLVARELNKLLNGSVDNKDLITARAVLKKFASNIADPQVLELTKSINFNSSIALDQSVVDMLKILTNSRHFKSIHKCEQINHTKDVNSNLNHSRHLNMILRYSELIQRENLSDSDHDLIQQIVRNLNKTVTK
jgi:hypothetical protein